MTTEPTTSRHNPMKVIFNYQNVFFSFFYDDADACVHRSREYAMNYVLSGEMVLDDGHRQIHVRSHCFGVLRSWDLAAAFYPTIRRREWLLLMMRSR